MVSIFKSSFFSIAGQKERLANVVGVVNAAFNPFSKSTVEANVSNPTMKTALETVSNHPYVTAGVIAGGYTLATKPAIAAATGKALIPTTTKGKIIAAVAAPVVIGAVSKAPVQFAKAAIEAPSQLGEFGSGIAQLATKPSLASAKELFKGSPILTTATLAAGAVIAGKGIFPAIATARQTEAIQEQTAAIEAATGVALPTEKANYTTSPIGVPSSPTVPVTPQTQTVAATGIRKARKKSKKERFFPSVSQKVNVLVSNRNRSSITKSLIKKEMLAY
jgi:hypothetical protein